MPYLVGNDLSNLTLKVLNDSTNQQNDIIPLK